MAQPHKATNMKDEWITPRIITKVLGPFDLDPCSPINPPWPIATRTFTREDDGLAQDWGTDFVWCNPPYGKNTGQWLKRMALHGNGIALIFARTETEMFHRYIWSLADSLLFLKGRLFFHHVDGTKAKYNCGAPSVLVGYGRRATGTLRAAAVYQSIYGKFISLSRIG